MIEQIIADGSDVDKYANGWKSSSFRLMGFDIASTRTSIPEPESSSGRDSFSPNSTFRIHF